MAEIPKQNKINKKYKITIIFALFLLTIPIPYQKLFSFFSSSVITFFGILRMSATT